MSEMITCPTCGGTGKVQGPPTFEDAIDFAFELQALTGARIRQIAEFGNGNEVTDYIILVRSRHGAEYQASVRKGMDVTLEDIVSLDKRYAGVTPAQPDREGSSPA